MLTLLYARAGQEIRRELLERLASTLIGEDLEIMLSILRDFALKGADKALQHLEK